MMCGKVESSNLAARPGLVQTLSDFLNSDTSGKQPRMLASAHSLATDSRSDFISVHLLSFASSFFWEQTATFDFQALLGRR